MPAPLYSNALAVGAAELGFLGAFAALVQRVPRQAAFVRGAGVLGLAGLTLVLQEAFAGLSANPHWRAVAAPVSWIQLMSASELLWVSRISAMSAGESVGLLWNLRRVGTKRQAKNTAATTCGGRARFVGRRLCTTLAAYLVIDAMLLAPSPDAALVAAGKDTLVQIRRLSVDDIIFRLVATFSFWLSTALLNLVMSNAVAIACVLTRLSSPKDCPPLYGPIREAYTIRRFWGNFWHQCLRCGLTGHADAIVDAALPVKRSSSVSRYARLFVAFLISGLIHRASDLAMGIPPAAAGSLSFFLLQPLGIMLEDAVQHLPLHSRLRPIIGYLWVALFLAWSTPVWFYPQQRLAIDPAALLPVRLLSPVLHQLRHT